MERIEKRVMVRAPALVESRDLVIETETFNLSVGGVFLLGVRDLAAGTVFTLRLTFDEGVFICETEVRWVRHQTVSAAEPAGCGCQFVAVSNEEREILREITERYDLRRASLA